MDESERKRKAEEDLSAIKVYKKQKTRRTLSTAMDTQEPGTQSVSDIHLSPAMDTQEPGTQSVSDIHQVEHTISDAAAQGEIPDKAANPDEDAIPNTTAIPDEGANPDEGATPDGETNPDTRATTDASVVVPVATQEPLTQSVKEGQATQEPPAQREGESLTEDGSGANTDGALQANPDNAEKLGESTDSDDDDFDGDDFNPDGAAIQVDLHKVGSVPGSSKHQPDSPAETLRKH